ncbi:MAG: rod shape-determining protein MreC [Prevotella sp.]|nr:rod shape-determining protein MreC [Prevotella sp.]
MKNLLLFLTRYNHCILFIILEVASFILIFRFNSYQGSVFFSSANVVAGKIYEWDSAVRTFFTMSTANRELNVRNLELEQMVRSLTEQLETVQKGDSATVKDVRSQVSAEYRLIPAKVITNSLNKKDNLITINKGEADGVRPDMGVACGNGVVGVVYMASQHYSVVIPILNAKSNISVRIKNRGYYGYLSWNGGLSDIAYVNDIPRYARFYRGAVIETSGYSSIFPPGIIVGKIEKAFNSHDGLSYKLQIRLSTDFGSLRDVCVIDNSSMEERIQLLMAAKDSLKIKTNE